MTVVSKMISGC